METGPRKDSGSTNSKQNNSTEISDSTDIATLPLVVPTKNDTTTDPMDIDQVVSPDPVGVIDTSLLSLLQLAVMIYLVRQKY